MNKVRRDSPRQLDHLHRVGGAAFGIGLGAFGVLGLTKTGWTCSPPTGAQVLGLSTNGALSIISIGVAVILIAAGMRGGHTASMVLVVIGAAFVLSGFVNALVLGMLLNLLAFQISNVIFSFIAGALLLFLGAWGRFAGHLPDDNPYQQERHLGYDTPEPLPSHFDDPVERGGGAGAGRG